MRYSSLLLLLSAISFTVFSAGRAGAQGIHETKVSLKVTNSTLKSIYKEIERQTPFRFVYQNGRAFENQQVGLKLSAYLADVLITLSQKTHTRYEQMGSNIVVTYHPPQQMGRITGRIVNSEGEALPGASLKVVELNQTVSADSDGNFLVRVQPGVYTVEGSYISYSSQQKKGVVVEAGKTTELIFTLEEGTSELGEVVVVGYGTQSKTKVTGAISQVKSEDLNKYASSNFAQQLAGKTAGVLINESTGMPGTDPQVIIRGVTTLTAGTKPLIVVDGFPLTEGTSMNSINANDIATIDILKDPASASIYGSRAANGVILITTKAPKTDKLSINFDVYSGYQMRSDKLKLIDAYQAAQYLTEARDQAYISKDPANRSISDDNATRIAKGASKRDLRLNYIDPYLNHEPGLTNTDWLNEIFRVAPMSNYNLSFSGKTGANTNFYISGSFFDQKGIVMGSDLKRYSSTLKLNSQISKRLNFGINLAPSFSDRGYHNEVGTAMGNFPFFSPYNDDGSLAISTQIEANTPEDGSLNENAVALTKLVTKKRKDFRTFGNSFLELNVIDGLKVKTMLGGDFATVFDDYFNPSNVGGYRTPAPKPASATETQGQVWNYLTENTLSYDKQFNEHHINVLAGYSYQQESSISTVVSGTGIPDNNLQNISGASNFSVRPTRYVWTQISYLARLQYDFQDTYLLSATFRRDGSSRFGKDSKWGNFPSVSAGWIVSNEDFFTSSKSVVDFLKLRASWGMAGNNQVGSYSSQALLSSGNYVNGNVLAPGYYASSAPNPLLSWETQKALNVGLDVNVFRKLSLGFNYYNTTTSDLLLDVPVPEQSGYSSSLQNIGEIRNTGFEFDFGGNNIQLGPVSWSFSANLSTNKNEVLSLAEGQEQIISGYFRTKVGGPIAEFYGYNILGIYKTQAELDNYPHLSGTRVGDNIMEDANGDGEISPDDRVGLGIYAPKLIYGFESSFNYKNIEFSFGLNGVSGRTVYDGSLGGQENGEAFAIPTEYYYKNRWHPVNNPNGTLPQATTSFSQNRLQTGWASSNHFVNADFIRVRNIQLAYNFSSNMANKMKVSGLNVYVAANNPFTFTPFRGLNPEGTSENVLQSGTANSNYPIAKSLMLGINLSL